MNSGKINQQSGTASARLRDTADLKMAWLSDLLYYSPVKLLSVVVCLGTQVLQPWAPPTLKMGMVSKDCNIKPCDWINMSFYNAEVQQKA